MKRLLLAGVAILGITGLANAAPSIAAGSVLNVVGAANFNATTVTTSSPAALSQNTGSFSPLLNCLSCVTVNQPSFVYSPSVGTGLLFTVSELSLMATISLDAGGTSSPTLNALTIDAPATLTMTGFASTPGTAVWTINQLGGQIGSFSFTADASAVPEPTTLAILGSGVLGLGLLRSRRRR
jgi:hypothetical protein